MCDIKNIYKRLEKHSETVIKGLKADKVSNLHEIREAYRIMIVRCTLSAYRHFVFCIGLVLACGIFIDVTERIVVFIFPLFGNSKNFCY